MTLHYNTLHYTTLTTLHHTSPYRRTSPHHTTLVHTPHYTSPHHTSPHHTTLVHTTLHCTTLHVTTLQHNIPQYITLYYGVILYQTAPILSLILSYGATLYSVILFHITSVKPVTQKAGDLVSEVSSPVGESALYGTLFSQK